jgi:hypothetical protein
LLLCAKQLFGAAMVAICHRMMRGVLLLLGPVMAPFADRSPLLIVEFEFQIYPGPAAS